MERPDLDAIRSALIGSALVPEYEQVDTDKFNAMRAYLAECLTYCRELEAENRRLTDRSLAAEQVIHEELPS